MNRFTFVKLGRTLSVAAALSLFAICWSGCGGDDNNPGNSNNNNGNGGDANHDSRLINDSGEAWLKGSSCKSAEAGFKLRPNGDFIGLNRDDDGDWKRDDGNVLTWRTDGNKLILNDPDSGRGQTGWYEISNGILTLKDDNGDNRTTYTQCSIGW